MKTLCVRVLVLLCIVVAGTAQSANPDPDPTTCYAPANEPRCGEMKAYLDDGFKRYVDPFIKKPDVASIEVCFQLCRHVVDGCKAVNYNKSTKECQFVKDLGTKADRATGTPDTRYKKDADYVSAVVNADKDDFCNSANEIVNHHRGGHDNIAWRGKATSSRDCAEKCVKDSECVAFDFNYAGTDTMWCFLKNKEIPKITPIHTTMTGLPCPLRMIPVDEISCP